MQQRTTGGVGFLRRLHGSVVIMVSFVAPLHYQTPRGVSTRMRATIRRFFPVTFAEHEYILMGLTKLSPTIELSRNPH